MLARGTREFGRPGREPYSGRMQGLPRSARFVVWANAWLTGRTSLDEAGDAIRADDAAHHVHGLPGETDGVPLLLALGALRREGARALRLALPEPGDPLGLAGPPEFNLAALELEEAWVADGTGLGAVPHVVGSGVQWEVQPATAPPPLSLPEADTELSKALLDAARALADLDVARWRPEVADELISLRQVGRRDDDALPPGYSARAEQLAARAERCLLIHALATEDDGGAVTAYDMNERQGALRPLARAARRALVAACDPDGQGRERV